MKMQAIKRVLIVDDDLAQQPLWKIIMKRCFPKSRLDWAISCEEAQRIIKTSQEEKDPVQFIITDIFLAGSGTGIDLLQSKEVADTQIPVMLVSVADEARIKSHFLKDSSRVAVLSKPLNIPRCERAISYLLEVHEA